jgi:Ca2+-binding RTX toxin-like protein
MSRRPTAFLLAALTLLSLPAPARAATGADVSVTATDSADPVLRGRDFGYTVTVADAGPQDATGVSAVATLPSEVSLVDAAGCGVSGSTVTCTWSTIAAGKSDAVTLGVHADAHGTATLDVTVSANESDPDTSNDDATQATKILGPTDCTVSDTKGTGLVIGTPGTDVLCGLAGDDVIEPVGGDDLVVGGPGLDVVAYPKATVPVTVNLATRRALIGGARADLLSVEGAIGGHKADVLLGDSGPNLLGGLGGDDTIDGKGGPDTADYHFCVGSGCKQRGVFVDLAAGVAKGVGIGTDALRSIEDVNGSVDGPDRLLGDAGTNILWGYGGHDRLFGRRGNDVLWGMLDADRLSGGPGIDFLDGGLGNDRCSGGTGIDSLVSCP